MPAVGKPFEAKGVAVGAGGTAHDLRQQRLVDSAEAEFGELQATISASQGIGLGLLAFFVGYPLGRRAGARASS